MNRKQRDEALNRIDILKLQPHVKEDFVHNVINVSYGGGLLVWANDYEKKIIKEFEQRHGCLVYHAIYNVTNFGRLLSLLYVSDVEKEWNFERRRLMKGRAFAYVKNLDVEDYSEFGTIAIGFVQNAGGLMRTY